MRFVVPSSCFYSSLCSWCLCGWSFFLRGVFLAHLIEEPFGVGSHFPGFRPKTKIDAPPITRHACLHDLRNQLIPIQDALSERSVRAGFIVVQSAVRIDEMDVGDSALELLQKLQSAAYQGFFLARLTGGDRGAHVGMAGVIEDAEIRVAQAANFVHDCQNLRRFVESKPRLKL